MIIILNICASVRKTCTGVHTWTGRDEEGGILRCILNESKSDSAARAHVSYISITEMRDSRSAPTRCISFVIIIFSFFSFFSFNKTLISFYFNLFFFFYMKFIILFLYLSSILLRYYSYNSIYFIFFYILYFKRKSRKWFPSIIKNYKICTDIYRTFFINSFYS